MRIVRRRKIAGLVVAALTVVVVLAATPAGAVTNWTAIWNNHLKPKADKRYVNESDLLWAVIDGTTGDLVRGNGVTFTDKSDTGDYQVRFNKNVRGCVYVATVGLPGSLGVELPGQIGVAGENASVRGVWVDTYDSLGAEADRSFHLIVDCDKIATPSPVAPRAGAGGDGASADGDNG
jgi:hypothetical protein